MTIIMKKQPNQITGNVGLYYTSYQLSKRGWNVLVTSRNAEGIDMVIYNQSGTKTHTIQVKSLSKKAPVPLGKKPKLIADFTIICRKVYENPEIFIAKSSELKKKIHEGIKNGEKSYWIQPKSYIGYQEKWEKIGNGDN